MISTADAAAFLPPTFQILTGLCFAAILVIRFMAAPMLRPLWGKLVAFSVLFLGLGNFLMSLATAKSSLTAGAEFFTYAGISFFAGALLIAIGFVVAARSARGAAL
jgi:hypothetical protein